MSQLNNNGQLQPLHPAQVLAAVKSDNIKATLVQLWSCKYPADPILEPEYVGLTYGQVALLIQTKRAALGDGTALDRILDRMIGKPQTLNTNVNVGASYTDFLDEVAKQEGVIDVDFRASSEPSSSSS